MIPFFRRSVFRSRWSWTTVACPTRTPRTSVMALLAPGENTPTSITSYFQLFSPFEFGVCFFKAWLGFKTDSFTHWHTTLLTIKRHQIFGVKFTSNYFVSINFFPNWILNLVRSFRFRFCSSSFFNSADVSPSPFLDFVSVAIYFRGEIHQNI